MFFFVPWKLRQSADPGPVPLANLAIIAVNVLLYFLCGPWPVGPGTGFASILLHAFSHGGIWHLLANMWALWVFGNPVNRRLGNGYYTLVYLGTALLLGLFARLLLFVPVVGASGSLFAVIAMALILMPAAVLEIAFVALFPLTLIVGLLSRPAEWWQWLVRHAVYGMPALWALAIIPLLQLFNFWWYHWDPGCLAHLLGMVCGAGAVLLLPERLTMRRTSPAW